MSWQAVNWLMNPPKAYGADYLVALAVAERTDKHGRGCYASDEDIARRANLCHFGELAEPDADASDETWSYYRTVRANSLRSTKRSLAKLAKGGVLRDDGVSRYGTRIRSVCMPDTVSADLVSDAEFGDDSGSDPGGLPESSRPDTVSGDADLVSGSADLVSETTDLVSPETDTVSPKPSLEPPGEPSTESECEPNPPNPPASGWGSINEAASGLSPSSPAGVDPPRAHLEVELREEEAELTTLEAQLSSARNPERHRQAIDVQRTTVADLRAQLGVDSAETRELVGAAA